MAPAKRRRSTRRPFVALLGIAALAGAGVTGERAFDLYSNSKTPASTVERYFEAVQSGDARSALAFSDQTPKSAYLTQQVLREQLKVAGLNDVVVKTMSDNGSNAVVQARYRLHFNGNTTDVTDEVKLVKRGKAWRIVNAAASIHVDAVGPGADRVMLAGRPLVDLNVVLFPGALPIATDSPAVVVDGYPSATLAPARGVVRVEAHLSDAARHTVAQAVDAAISACLTSARPDPRCPMPLSGRVVPGTIHGTPGTKFASGGASIDLSSDGKGVVAFGGVVAVSGTWKAWDFNNQVIASKGELRLAVRAKASIDDLKTIIWSDE